MATARFVGVGVGEYDKGHLRLNSAVPDVEAVADLLEDSFECGGMPPSWSAAGAAGVPKTGNPAGSSKEVWL